MALFAQDDAWIRARLRLTSVPASSEDTLAIIGEAIVAARIEILSRLGRQAVDRILAITADDTPETDDEIRRARATRVELDLVRVYLLRELPNAFMDASGDLNRRWNEEAPFRERPRSNRESEIARLMAQIEEGMQFISGDGTEAPGDESRIMVYDGTPDLEPPLPGETLTTFPDRFVAED